MPQEFLFGKSSLAHSPQQYGLFSQIFQRWIFSGIKRKAIFQSTQVWTEQQFELYCNGESAMLASHFHKGESYDPHIIDLWRRIGGGSGRGQLFAGVHEGTRSHGPQGGRTRRGSNPARR